MTRNLSTGENVQKWTRYFLLFFPTRPSDEYDAQRRVENTRVHFWTFPPVSVKSNRWALFFTKKSVLDKLKKNWHVIIWAYLDKLENDN